MGSSRPLRYRGKWGPRPSHPEFIAVPTTDQGNHSILYAMPLYVIYNLIEHCVLYKIYTIGCMQRTRIAVVFSDGMSYHARGLIATNKLIKMSIVRSRTNVVLC